MAAFSTIALIAVAVVGAVAAHQQGQAAKKEADFRAGLDERQAARERTAAAEEERDFRRRQSALMAERRARLGASGVRPGAGSPLLASKDFASEVEIQALRLREGGEARATRLEESATLLRRSGSNAAQRGLFRAGSSLLSGVAGSFR